MDSRLVARHDRGFKIYRQLLSEKIITVVLDTAHDVHDRALDRTRRVCRSHPARIAEVEQGGSPNEKVLPPGAGHGFLWRWYSCRRFVEGGRAACFECRATSPTRDLPYGMGWRIEPIIPKPPKESLIPTLEATR
jgi:hypothetical protein